MSQLSIYKASAGSGKTFQLAREYLKLIFNPKERFSTILGVTFTNKATAEMRERILKELFVLSLGQPSAHAEPLMQEHGYTIHELKEKARQLLNQILHNYSQFNISTIDSFFQRILKAFTREVGLNTGFNVELNHKQVLEEVIARFFDELTNDSPYKEWLSQFSLKKMEEGKGWDIQHDLFNFASDAFTEAFYAIDEEELNKYGDIKFFLDYRKTLDKQVGQIARYLEQKGQEGLEIIQKHGLTVNDFSYKTKGVAGFFQKLTEVSPFAIEKPNSYVLKAYASDDNIKGWCAQKAANRAAVEQCVVGGLKSTLATIINYYEQHYETYQTAIVIRSNLDVFALIAEIFNRLNEYCNEKNIFLLPLASPLLAKIIGNNDAPFIYEKTGEILKHFMIDEFQDTSNLQWRNFFPLVQNGLAQKNYSLVVGDVKQSIYRWRNSDWTLLESKLAQQFKFAGVEEINLPYNWRSDRNIVLFNNWVFQNITKITALGLDDVFRTEEQWVKQIKRIDDIYQNAVQKIPDKREVHDGFVRLGFVERMESNEETQQLALSKMVDTILDLHKAGYQPRDIAILVRQNKEGAMVARYLMHYRQLHPELESVFQFVSNDSVFLGASTSIQLLASIVSFMVEPSDQLIRAQVVHLYVSLKHNSTKAFEVLTGSDFSSIETVFDYLPKSFKAEFEQIKQLPLTELISALIRIFIYESLKEIAQSEKAFINAFQDAVHKFTQNQGGDLTGFVDWWNNFGATTPISLSDDQNAIKILTIHKAKGLEYNALILPFVNWTTDQRSILLWCHTKPPFDRFKQVPILYSKKLTDTHFKNTYAEERLLAMVDNINLLYVAFTRAKKALYIFSAAPSQKISQKNMSDVLYTLVDNEITSLPEGLNWDESAQTAEMGALQPLRKGEDKTDKNQEHELKLGQLTNIKISLRAPEFFKDLSDGEFSSASRGKIYHEVLENVIHHNDLNKAIKKLELKGIIAYADRQVLFDKLQKTLAKKPFVDWFSGKYKVKTELNYLMANKSVKRPDRIMYNDKELIVVDYKFTHTKSQAHYKQVKQYMSDLADIENVPIVGYVWYVLNEELIRVE